MSSGFNVVGLAAEGFKTLGLAAASLTVVRFMQHLLQYSDTAET